MPLRPVWIIVSIVFILLTMVLLTVAFHQPKAVSYNLNDLPTTMKLTSPAFADLGTIPAQYTCDGPGVNPPLELHDIPAGTKSLVLMMEDPDVPRNFRVDGIFVHWLVWNIPSSTTSFPENSEPSGVVGKNSGGKIGFTPPCPPNGSHRYFFRVFALDTELVIPSNASNVDVKHAMQNNILAQGELMGRYERHQ